MIYETTKTKYTLPFELYPYQVETVDALGGLPRAGYYLEPGCVSADTEFLTPIGWKRIDQWEPGDKVAQFEPDTREVSFVEPIDYIVRDCDRMIAIAPSRGTSQRLSHEHRVLYYMPDGSHATCSAAEFMSDLHSIRLENLKRKFCTTFTVSTGRSLPLTDWEIRIMVAVIADGYFGSSSKRCVVRVKKSRKKARLQFLLKAWGAEYKRKACGGQPEFSVFSFYAPRRDKEFTAFWWEASQAQLEVIADEIRHWDSSEDRRRTGATRFSTLSKASADFAQYAFAASKRTASLAARTRDRTSSGRGVATEFLVHAQADDAMPGPGRRTSVYEVDNPEGKKYCFEVPSTFLLLRHNGHIFATGNTGKTACSTVSALYKKETRKSQTIVIMPPILLEGWARFLRSITPALSVTVYKGTPKKRLELSLNADFVLLSTQIFKQDFDRLSGHFQGKPVTLIVDEATSIKSVSSANHKMVHNFTLNNDCDVMLLTGTPLTTPADAYAYIKLVAPGTYRNLGQFEKIHVADRDFFDNVKSWQHLDVLASNMAINSRRILKEDVLDQLPPVTYTVMTYDLAPAHLKLYTKLAEEQLLLLKDGGKIDATNASALWNKLQQIVLNWSHFAQDAKLRPAGYDVLDETLSELSGRKLLVFANYRLSNRALVEYLAPHNAVDIYGDVSGTQKEKNLRRFIEDESCHVLVAQPTSAGYGVDGLQDVCSDVLFLESPLTPTHFEQALSRIYRNGQRLGVQCRIAVANSTLQVRLHKALLDKDDLVAQVAGKYDTLRNMLHGG